MTGCAPTTTLSRLRWHFENGSVRTLPDGGFPLPQEPSRCVGPQTQPPVRRRAEVMRTVDRRLRPWRNAYDRLPRPDRPEYRPAPKVPEGPGHPRRSPPGAGQEPLRRWPPTPPAWCHARHNRARRGTIHRTRRCLVRQLRGSTCQTFLLLQQDQDGSGIHRSFIPACVFIGSSVFAGNSLPPSRLWAWPGAWTPHGCRPDRPRTRAVSDQVDPPQGSRTDALRHGRNL